MFEYRKIFKNIHLEFFNNKHKHMKVIDTLGEIC
jgi:hypothetical protein